MSVTPGALQELDSLLQSLQSLKPPGVNKTKVESITKICTAQENASKQVLIVDNIGINFNRSPPTHKLGVMYIVDSVARQWKATGPTWSAGVNRITEIFPSLMNNLLQVAPENQKEKISKLLDIWISSKTFPDPMLASYKKALALPTQSAPTSPPTNTSQGLAQGANSNQQIAHQVIPGNNGVAPPPPNTAATALLAALGNVQQPGFLPQPPPALNAAAVVNPPPVNISAPVFPATMPQPATTGQNALASLLNGGGAQGPANPLASQLQILQGLASQLSPEQFAAVIHAMGIPLPAVQPQGNAVPPPPFPPASAPPAQTQYQPPPESSQYRYDDRSRARSRSPDYNRRQTPPNRRDSPTYGVYDPSGANTQSPQVDNDRRGRGKGRGSRNDYRQRSPQAPRDQLVSNLGAVPPSNMPKPMGYDPNIPNGKIRVLSRTLFIGGVNAKTNEAELKQFFSRFGNVQTCIVNHEKRHAFLKLISHGDAHATKQSVDKLPNDEYRGKFERIGWAVGFGPTSCADYSEGTSEIPIGVLTDADRKWMLSAEFGGTGGKPIESGMIVEEPDIEIGAGPSSKAISRRGGGGAQGRGGGNFNQRRGFDRHAPFRKQDERRQGQSPAITSMPEPNTIGAPPAVPTFGAPIPGLPSNFR